MKEIKITGGTFTMGSPPDEEGRFADETQREVTVGDFLMDETAVTGDLWSLIMGEGDPTIDGNEPKISVSWYDAIRFCNERSKRAELPLAYKIDGEVVTLTGHTGGYRLPNEAEWEYACRAGTTGPRYGELDEIAVYGASKVAPVKTKKPNAFGLYDMLGNVWEWCWDVYSSHPGEESEPARKTKKSKKAKRAKLARDIVDELLRRTK